MLLRLLILIILFVVIYRVFKSWTGKQPRMPGRQTRNIADDMVQDPQCGIYFPRREGISASHQGNELLFCSEPCKQAYLDEHRDP